MCSRFCIDQEMWRELKELFGDLDRMFSGWKWNRSGQDIRPTNQSLVITAGEDNRLEPAAALGPAGFLPQEHDHQRPGRDRPGKADVPGQRGLPAPGGPGRQVL